MAFLLDLAEDVNATGIMNVLHSCRDVNQVNASDQCLFIQTTADCKSQIGYVDYNSFMYCTFSEGNSFKAVGIAIVWLLVLFVGLGVTANEFLCPALFVISKNLKLSQNVAGVTLLAFGNGAPDIFSALAGIQQGKTELVVGGLVGAGIFVTTVVAGSIFLTQPFRMVKRPFVRDVIFYLTAAAWVFYLFFHGSIELYHAIGFIILYLLYIVVVIVSRMIHQKRQTASTAPSDAAAMKKAEAEMESGQQHCQQQQQHAVDIHFQGEKPEDDPEAVGVVLKSFYFYNNGFVWDDSNPNNIPADFEPPSEIYIVPAPYGDDLPDKKMSICSTDMARKASVTSCNKEQLAAAETDNSQFKLFLEKVCPVDLEKWDEQSWFNHIVELTKGPVLFMITLTTPVVDYRTKMDNWCRSLNVMHCITGPMFIVFASGNGMQMVGGVVPLAAIIFVPSAALAVVVFCTSTNSAAPRYHCVFAYFGFGVSVTWIYIISIEIVVLLQAIGIVFNLSDALIGLTILAWGNCLLDFMSNLSVARSGFPRMGIAACFGSPFLTLLIGVGVPCVIKLLSGFGLSGVPLQFSPLVVVLFCTLGLSLLSTSASMMITSFHTKRPYGLYLIMLYVMFLITAILVELGVLF